MITYKINGSSTKKYSGTVRCNGAKNVAVKAMMIALLTDEISVLTHMPAIGDVEQTKTLLESVGVKFETVNTQEQLTTEQSVILKNLGVNIQELVFPILFIDPSNVYAISTMTESSNRTAVSLLGILARKFDQVDLPNMGGCALGQRNIDFHETIYTKFGFELIEHNDQCQGQLKLKRRKDKKDSTGQYISLPYPSVGATETALCLAVLTPGESLIENIATEAEIMEVISMLQCMGAQIYWHNANSLRVIGVEKLNGTAFQIMSDRLELVSWAALAALSDGDITVTHLDPIYVQSVLGVVQAIGAGVQYVNQHTIRFFRAKETLQACNLNISNYPCITTDQAAQIITMLAAASGTSLIHETVFDDRTIAIHNMLSCFGVQSHPYPHCVLNSPCRFEHQNKIHSLAIHGLENTSSLKSPKEPVTLPKNIRCSHSYILLAAVTNGHTTLIDETKSVIRGYGNNLIDKLQSLGVDIACE